MLFNRKCDVINRGFSGYNTRWNRILLPRLVTSDNAGDIVVFVIFLGANDACVKHLSPGHHIPVHDYRNNLVAMVDYLKVSSISYIHA